MKQNVVYRHNNYLKTYSISSQKLKKRCVFPAIIVNDQKDPMKPTFLPRGKRQFYRFSTYFSKSRNIFCYKVVSVL